MPHRCRAGAVVPRRDEGQPPQNGGDGDNIDDGSRFGLVQLLRSALTRPPTPGGAVPVADKNLKFTLSLEFVCKKYIMFLKIMYGLHIVYTKLLWGACYVW
jgi:hypothetical protein